MNNDVYISEWLASQYTGINNLSKMQKIIIDNELYYNKTNVTMFGTCHGDINMRANDFIHIPEHRLVGDQSVYIHEDQFLYKSDEIKQYNTCNLKLGKYIMFGSKFIDCKKNNCICQDCIGRCYSDVRLIPEPFFMALTGLNPAEIIELLSETKSFARQLVSRTLGGVDFMNFTLDSKRISDTCMTIIINDTPYYTHGELLRRGISRQQVENMYSIGQLDRKCVFGYKLYCYIDPKCDYVTLYTLSRLSLYPFDVLNFFNKKGILKTKRIKNKITLYCTNFSDSPFVDAGFRPKEYYLANGMGLKTFNRFVWMLHLRKKEGLIEDTYNLKKEAPFPSFNRITFMRYYGLTIREFYDYRIKGRIIIDKANTSERAYIFVSDDKAVHHKTLLDIHEYTKFYGITTSMFYRWRDNGKMRCNSHNPPIIIANIEQLDYQYIISIKNVKYYATEFFIKRFDLNRRYLFKFTSRPECMKYTKKYNDKIKVDYYTDVNLIKDDNVTKKGKILLTRETIQKTHNLDDLKFYPLIFEKKITKVTHKGYFLYYFN